MVKTNCSTFHTVYNIQQSATQGSNDTTHRLSRRTAATIRFSPEGIGCQKQTALRSPRNAFCRCTQYWCTQNVCQSTDTKRLHICHKNWDSYLQENWEQSKVQESKFTSREDTDRRLLSRGYRWRPLSSSCNDHQSISYYYTCGD